MKTSQYRGVSANGEKWRARITVAGEEHYLGSFATEEEAARAYDRSALNFYGDQANLNNVPDAAPVAPRAGTRHDEIVEQIHAEIAEQILQELQTEQPAQQQEDYNVSVANFKRAVASAILDQNSLDGALSALDFMLGSDLAGDHLASLVHEEHGYEDDEEDFFDDEDEDEEDEDDGKFDTGWEKAPAAPKQAWY